MEIIIYCKAFIIGVFFTLIIFLTGEIIKDKKSINKVHFYVARDKDEILWLYIGKPIRKTCTFFSCDCGKILISSEEFSKFGLNTHDFDYLKWEDEPIEVFLNLEN